MRDFFPLLRVALFAVAILLFNAPFVQATAASPTFAYQAVTSSFSATPGATLSINIYLTETSATSLLQNEQGLSDSGVTIARTSGDATFSLATPNGAFDDSSSSGTFSNAGANPSATFVLHISLAGQDTMGVLTSSNQTLLGVIQLTMGSTASTFTVANPSKINQSITFKDIYDLDVSNNSTANGAPVYASASGSAFTVVTSTPEPGAAFALIGCASLFSLRRRRVSVESSLAGTLKPTCLGSRF